MSPRRSCRRARLGGRSLSLLIATALATIALPSTAQASHYRMVMCAATNGVPAYDIATNAGGLFETQNSCQGEGGDPPGESAYLRIYETQVSGLAPYGDYARISWTVPSAVAIAEAGAYTREPNSFNQGWRARLWVEGFDGTETDILRQDIDASNSGVSRAPTASFQNNLWPGPSPGRYRRFSFEMICVRAAGCDESGFNAADANGFVLTLSDEQDPEVSLEGGPSGLLAGEWVGGGISSFDEIVAEHGSGVRAERTWVDGVQVHSRDHAWECQTGFSQRNREWATSFVPCSTVAGAQYPEWLDTSTLADGAHILAYCVQDFGQFQGLDSTNGESCDTRTIRVDHTAPGTPLEMHVTSANSARYLTHFGAKWSLPPDSGSPIETIHYEIVNSSGDVVVPEQIVSAGQAGFEPTELTDIEGPNQPGEYTLRLWLQDSVGRTGPAATAPIPHDTTAPAAPQNVSVTPPSVLRSAEGFDVRWHNITDAGSPIAAVHYEVLTPAGGIPVPQQSLSGTNIEAIPDLVAPGDIGSYTLKLWLSDEEGNVGAPATVPLAYECVGSHVSTATNISAGLGAKTAASEIVQQGTGSALRGELLTASFRPVAAAPLCVFSRVLTDPEARFVGIAVTNASGEYEFPIAAGPSRELSAVYRSNHREIASRATIETVVHPSFRVRRKLVYNKHSAHFSGQVPGPHNNGVVVVLQVRQGHGWLVFRSVRTGEGGNFSLAYRFRRTFRPTRYTMRVEILQTVGYPYRPGTSSPLTLLVRPKPHHRR